MFFVFFMYIIRLRAIWSCSWYFEDLPCSFEIIHVGWKRNIKIFNYSTNQFNEALYGKVVSSYFLLVKRFPLHSTCNSNALKNQYTIFSTRPPTFSRYIIYAGKPSNTRAQLHTSRQHTSTHYLTIIWNNSRKRTFERTIIIIVDLTLVLGRVANV